MRLIVHRPRLRTRVELLEHRRLLSADFEWSRVLLGAGGYQTGLVVHPNTPDLVYARSDVQGAYKWNSTLSRWDQIVTADTMPDEQVANQTGTGVDAIAVDPSNPDIVLLAQDRTGIGGGVYRGVWSNGQLSFTRSNITVNVTPNNNRRTVGERLMVDPNNSQIVWYGTLNNGLFLSADNGQTFQPVTAGGAPGGTEDLHIISIDKNAGLANGRSAVVYVTAKSNVYRTIDGGASWTQINGGTLGGPDGSSSVSLDDADVAADGTLWVTDSGTRRVWKYKAGAAWGTNGSDWLQRNPANNQSFSSVAVDPHDPSGNTVFVSIASNTGRTWRTTNGGSSWTQLSTSIVSPGVPWHDWTADRSFLSMGEVVVDPFERGKLWFAQGRGVAVAQNAHTGNSIQWREIGLGIENLVMNEIVKPPGGALIPIVWDRTGFHIPDPASGQYPSTHLINGAGNDFSSGWDASYSGQNPNFIALVSEDYRDRIPHYSGYSTDGGATWARFGSITSGTHPSVLSYGNIVVSATDTNRIVWLPSGTTDDHVPWYTTDRGQTWHKSSGAPSGLHGVHFRYLHALAADPVQGNVFYLWDHSSSRRDFYRSTDHGATWQKVSDSPPGSWDNFVLGQLVPVYDRSGDLWVAGTQDGLWRSIDGGANWVKSTHFANGYVADVSFGKPMPGASYPTVFVYGSLTSRTGPRSVYWSRDAGATFELVDTYPLGIFDQLKTISGDPDVYGRVYVGFGGASVAYADLVDQTPPTVESMVFEFETRHALRITWSEEIASTPPAGALTVTRTDGVTRTPDTVTYDAATRTATFVFNTRLADGDWTPSLSPYTARDASGNAAGSTQSGAAFHVLAGDVNRDRSVGFSDLLIIAQNYGLSGRTFSTGNVSYDAAGVVGFDDLLIVAQTYGDVLLMSSRTPATSSRSRIGQEVLESDLA